MEGTGRKLLALCKMLLKRRARKGEYGGQSDEERCEMVGELLMRWRPRPERMVE
jgi:hypothetical protein